MPLRRVVSLFALATVSAGCASGEPTGRLSRDLDLAETERALIDAELIVEVTNKGIPVIADAVWLWDGGAESADADCMIHQGLGRCGTWFASMEAQGPITVFADVCGELYSQPLAFAVSESADSFALSTQLTVEADATHCGRQLPMTCEDESIEPALNVTTVDPDGEPLAVRNVEIEVSAGDSVRADCLEGVSARGCTEWASQHTKAGRYRAVVKHCGETVHSDWVGVVTDDSGCKTIPKSIEVELDPAACEFAL